MRFDGMDFHLHQHMPTCPWRRRLGTVFRLYVAGSHYNSSHGSACRPLSTLEGGGAEAAEASHNSGVTSTLG